jgi:hypothetical protein
MALSVRFHPAARAQLFDLYEYIAAETGQDHVSLAPFPQRILLFWSPLLGRWGLRLES